MVVEGVTLVFVFGSLSDHSSPKGDANLICTRTPTCESAGSGLFRNAAQQLLICGGAREVHAF